MYTQKPIRILVLCLEENPAFIGLEQKHLGLSLKTTNPKLIQFGRKTTQTG
jgi:hypothetical protein